jgi:hypothetical protein
MNSVLIEVSAHEQPALAHDLAEFSPTTPYPMFEGLAQTGNLSTPPHRYRCEVSYDFLEKFPRWKAHVVKP